MQLCILCNHLKSNDGPVIQSHMIHCLSAPVGDQPSSVSANLIYCQKSMRLYELDSIHTACLQLHERGITAFNRPQAQARPSDENVQCFVLLQMAQQWPHISATSHINCSNIMRVIVNVWHKLKTQSKRTKEPRTSRAMEKAGADLEGNSIHSPGHAL